MIATERLYFADAELSAFTADVLAVHNDAAGCRIALTCSAFYPEGGGQPADRGTLNGVAVEDVQIDDDGIVWHRLAADAAAPLPGTAVAGRIDRARRRDHMQQHCGQHILTAAFIATSAIETVSFHLSDQSVTIDLATAQVTDAQLRAAEAWANEQIWADLPIHARFVDATELATLRLRKPPSVTEQIRIVSIGAIDHSACGGTHPARSGGVGALAVLSWEKQRGQARVTFACGGRMVRLLQQQRERLAGIAGMLQVSSDETTTAVERLMLRQSRLSDEITALERAHDDLLGEQLSGQGVQHGAITVIERELPGLSPARLRRLAQQISTRSGAVVMLTATDREQQRVVIAASGHEPANARGLLQRYLAVTGGRGGGSPTLAEGGGPAAQADAARAVLHDHWNGWSS